ncbi:unnamed protein product [Paramecium octaurelia]|uniref:Uncharacterized protein n=1 Tax=Paramecium octaurelia TaxID=43137 RepID=A0A8S1UYB2_PAROT|nr:unnamed protein product [Paramecium octaurelia]
MQIVIKELTQIQIQTKHNKEQRCDKVCEMKLLQISQFIEKYLD